MKFLTCLVVFVLLVETISATSFNREDKEKKISFSVAKEWESFSKKDACCGCNCSCVDPNKETKEKVQEYYDGCREVTWEFRGEAYVIADNVMKSFEDYLKKLFFFSGTNSTLPANSNAMLVTMGKCNKMNKSALNIIFEFEKVLPTVVIDFKNVADNLTPYLGDLTCSFKEALDELGCVFRQVMKDFLLSCKLTGCKLAVDYEPVFKKLQKLMNTVAFIAETALKNKCEIKPEVQESVTILSAQFWYFNIVAQGIYSCVMDTLYENECVVVQTTTSVSMSFNYALVSFTQAISTVVQPISQTITGFLATFVNLTAALNTLVKDILGLFGGLTITAAEVTQNILKNIKLTQLTSTLKGRTNIVKGFALN
ncbi:uncharacterized protein LOC119077075 [Bradysia coprophila]|uniref:uncharacterized protein LOC119077075 n=1 Tax=Bradysia coprophila TaxID=38358 RepID=UPI00187DB840|nr:uncharacterized protein LOC119077075 [Bradysia coprophila]